MMGWYTNELFAQDDAQYFFTADSSAMLSAFRTTQGANVNTGHGGHLRAHIRWQAFPQSDG
jgi:hypothetical protein